MVFGHSVALVTVDTAGIDPVHDPFKARVLIGELGVEVLNVVPDLHSRYILPHIPTLTTQPRINTRILLKS